MRVRSVRRYTTFNVKQREYIDYPWFLVHTLLEHYEAALWHNPGIGTQSVPIRYFLPDGTREKCTKRANIWSTYIVVIGFC